MIEFEHNIQINRPVEHVFRFIADPENFPSWQTGVVRSTVTSPGPIGAGTTFTETVKILGRVVRTTCEITQFDPGRKMCFKATSKPIAYAGQFTFDGVGEGTQLTVYGAGQLRGLWRFTEPIFGPELRKETRAEMQKIKDLLENTTPS